MAGTPVTAAQGQQSGRSEPIGCLFCLKQLGAHRSFCPFLHHVFSNPVWPFLREREKTHTGGCKPLNKMNRKLGSRGPSPFPCLKLNGAWNRPGNLGEGRIRKRHL